MSAARKITPSPIQEVDVTTGVAIATAGGCSIGIGQSLSPEGLLGLVMDGGFRHICQKKGFKYDAELMATRQMIQDPTLFLKYPVASILTPGELTREAELRHLLVDEKFKGSEAKRGILDRMVESMLNQSLSQTMLDDVISVADELFTNAVYNAPFTDLKTHHNPGVSRQYVDVTYEPGKEGHIFLAHDNQKLIVGCRDPFGTLSLEKYFKMIRATAMQGAAATMSFGSGGAGLGSYIIFNTGSSLYAGVWPGQCTQITCVIPLGMSYLKRSQMPKHIHWIQP